MKDNDIPEIVFSEHAKIFFQNLVTRIKNKYDVVVY